METKPETLETLAALEIDGDDVLETVRDACARMLFLAAVADECDRMRDGDPPVECPACGAIDPDAWADRFGEPFDGDGETADGLASALADGDPCPACGRDFPTAYGGADWADVLDGLETPAEAFAYADDILGDLRRPRTEPTDPPNGRRLGVLDALLEWAQACGFAAEDIVEPFDRFGSVAGRFGSVLAHSSRGDGVGFADDTKPDGRAVRRLDDMVAVGLRVPGGVALLDPDGFVGSNGIPNADACPFVVVEWASRASAYIVEGGRFYAEQAEAFVALRATRYEPPTVPRYGEDFGVWAFDFAAVLDGEGVA
jgi:hypothetical protein